MARTVIGVVCILAMATVTGCGGSSHGTETSNSTGPKPRFTVNSSLAGMRVLPHRIHWIARPSLAAVDITGVEFLIDGRVVWVEHHPPYDYGSSENGHLAYLVTSWLSPGPHRFTVRATSISGRTASRTVVTSAVTPPAPPSTLAGTWERTINTADAPVAGSPGNPTSTYTPPGRYTITFERRWIRDHFPGRFVYPQSNQTGHGFIFLDDYTVSPGVLRVAGEVIFHEESDTLAEGGSWCYGYGPPAVYHWTVTANRLLLAPVNGKDACGIRGYIWTGTWTRGG